MSRRDERRARLVESIAFTTARLAALEAELAALDAAVAAAGDVFRDTTDGEVYLLVVINSEPYLISRSTGLPYYVGHDITNVDSDTITAEQFAAITANDQNDFVKVDR